MERVEKVTEKEIEFTGTRRQIMSDPIRGEETDLNFRVFLCTNDRSLITVITFY